MQGAHATVKCHGGIQCLVCAKSIWGSRYLRLDGSGSLCSGCEPMHSNTEGGISSSLVLDHPLTLYAERYAEHWLAKPTQTNLPAATTCSHGVNDHACSTDSWMFVCVHCDSHQLCPKCYPTRSREHCTWRTGMHVFAKIAPGEMVPHIPKSLYAPSSELKVTRPRARRSTPKLGGRPRASSSSSRYQGQGQVQLQKQQVEQQPVQSLSQLKHVRQPQGRQAQLQRQSEQDFRGIMPIPFDAGQGTARKGQLEQASRIFGAPLARERYLESSVANTASALPAVDKFFVLFGLTTPFRLEDSELPATNRGPSCDSSTFADNRTPGAKNGTTLRPQSITPPSSL
jgi:hypothetical protein